MFQANLIRQPLCGYEECGENALYEFTDVILADPEKRMEDRKLKTIVIAHSCDNHYKEIREKYAE